ncbi:MAG: hypothetical protein L0Z48_10700 [candidate division Zixibacteria bacterium]|nr:hypothetical protein [candidate division Zixibacteria bacterium]
MEQIYSVENPGRRRRGRRRAKARRNPEMLAIGNPKRRKRKSRKGRSFAFSLRARGWRRNPGFGGKIPFLGYPVASLMYLAVGATGTSFLSGMVLKWVPFLQPKVVPAGAQPDFFERAKPYIVDLVAAFGTAKVAGMVFKSRQAENEVLTGGLAVPLLRLLRTEVFTKIGLSGADAFDLANFQNLGYFAENNGMGYFGPAGTAPSRSHALSGWSDELGRRRMRAGADQFMN